MSGGSGAMPERAATQPGVTPAPDAVAAIGELALLAGFRLAGVGVHACDSEPEVLRAWTALPKDTAVVILTPRSAKALGTALSDPNSPLTVVLPA